MDWNKSLGAVDLTAPELLGNLFLKTENSKQITDPQILSECSLTIFDRCFQLQSSLLIFLAMKFKSSRFPETPIRLSWEAPLAVTHAPTHKQMRLPAEYPSQQSREIGMGATGLQSVSRSSFMFDIAHKLFTLPVCGGGWCLRDGLACLRLRLDQLF